MNKTVVFRDISSEAAEWLLAPESIRNLTAYVEKRAAINKPPVKEFVITHKASDGKREKAIVLGTSAQHVKIKFKNKYEIISVRSV